MKNILIRVDSSFDIGTGHVMRDLVLATQYPHDNIIFYTQKLKGNINQKIQEHDYKIHIAHSHDIIELIEYINFNYIDLLIIDHYGIDYKFEKTLKEKTGIEIMVLDDTYEAHYCDILLNHNIYADHKKYQNLVPKYCQIRCGANYTLLRDEFLNIKSVKKIDRAKRLKIFMAMGGADSKYMNIALLEKLKSLSIDIELVATHANKNLEELKKYVAQHNMIKLHIDSKNIANIICRCNLAIVTPSVMVNEIIFLKIPFISVMVTDNQYYMDKFLKQQGFPCIDSSELYLIPSLIEKFRDLNYYTQQLKQIDTIVSKGI